MYEQHGLVNSREYRSWYAMKTRCYNKNQKQYADYGGRGIRVCKRWKNSFVNFLQDMGKCPSGATLDRENNDGNYTPRNCRWATRVQQNRNHRRSPLYKLNDRDVLRIRALEGIRRPEVIARIYSISMGHVYRIFRGTRSGNANARPN